MGFGGCGGGGGWEVGGVWGVGGWGGWVWGVGVGVGGGEWGWRVGSGGGGWGVGGGGWGVGVESCICSITQHCATALTPSWVVVCNSFSLIPPALSLLLPCCWFPCSSCSFLAPPLPSWLPCLALSLLTPCFPSLLVSLLLFLFPCSSFFSFLDGFLVPLALSLLLFLLLPCWFPCLDLSWLIPCFLPC